MGAQTRVLFSFGNCLASTSAAGFFGARYVPFFLP